MKKEKDEERKENSSSSVSSRKKMNTDDDDCRVDEVEVKVEYEIEAPRSVPTLDERTEHERYQGRK